MRKAIIMLLMAVALSACEKTPEQRAEKLIMEYLEKNANDPSSVQDVKVEGIVTMEGMKNKKQKFKYASVTYRAKNAYGALVKDEVYVKFDTLITELICFDCLD